MLLYGNARAEIVSVLSQCQHDLSNWRISRRKDPSLIRYGLHPSHLILFLPRKFTSPITNYLIGPAARGMKINRLSFISELSVASSSFSVAHLLLFFSLCLSRTSFPLRSGYKTNKAWPRGGKQPPKVRQHRKNGVSGKERCRSEADDPHENWRHPAIAWVTRFTCSPIKKEGR